MGGQNWVGILLALSLVNYKLVFIKVSLIMKMDKINGLATKLKFYFNIVKTPSLKI